MFTVLLFLLLSPISGLGPHPPHLNDVRYFPRPYLNGKEDKSCKIAGQMSHDCESNCEEYCLKIAWCELDRTTTSIWPGDADFCGAPWQAKCICKTCQGGFCGKVKQKIDQAIPIAQRHVQHRIDQLTASLNGDAYGKFAEGVVPYHEGNNIASVAFSREEDCKSWCDQRSDCKSFARCDDNKKCWFKSLELTGHESARNIGRCTTYYKKSAYSGFTFIGAGDCRCTGNSHVRRYRHLSYTGQLSDCVQECRQKNWCQAVAYENGGCYLYVKKGSTHASPGANWWTDQANIQGWDCTVSETNTALDACYVRNDASSNWQSGDTGLNTLRVLKPADEWNKYFGNRNTLIRKSFMLNVLQDMKRYLADVGYSSSNMVQLIAKPKGEEKARMSCNRWAPCYGGEEKTWPQKIGFNVNVNSPSLVSNTKLNKVAALMIHELTHSTAVASRKNLAVIGNDIPLTQANVGTHENKLFLATRDWTYDPNEVKNYATCYESGVNCPGAKSDFNNRPAVNMNMDIPLNNAASYEHWILYVNEHSSNCVSGDMLVESESSGPIKAGALVAGMKIRGRDANGKSQWCTVQDVYFNGMGTLFGNFTEEHLVLDDSSGMVLPSGNSSHEHFGARYTLFTDCPVMENTDGELFTPLAQTFCGAQDFTWSEYLVLWRAVQQVVRDTGMFWFHLDETFINCKNETLCGGVTDWRDALPPVCESMMSCAASQDDVICDDFEEVAQNFFDRHVRAERVEEIKNAYAQYGSISQSVKDSSKNESLLWMWAAIVAGALACIMTILLVTWRCCCQKNQVEDDNQVVVV